MDDLTLEIWPIEKLVPYARNPRKNDVVIKKMAAAIKEFGFRIPIVAKSDGSIVDGHLRLKAAQILELKEIPVVLADNLSDAQVRAFRILANRSASWAEWDRELLQLEVADLQLEDYPLELTGLDDAEIDDLLMSSVLPEMPDLPSGDKEPYQQKTFTLHDEQAAVVDEALSYAKDDPNMGDDLNQNSNGNALYLICRQWLDSRHG